MLSGSGIDYEPVGSTGGIMRLSDPEVDFAVSDYPLFGRRAQGARGRAVPIALGAIAVVHSVDLPEGQDLRLDARTVAAVFLGEISVERPEDRGAEPGGDAARLRRVRGGPPATGPGHERVLPATLSEGSPQWAAGPGTGTEIAWPTGTGAERTEGVIAQVRNTAGSIGYVDHGQAGRAGLDVIALSNQSGAYVRPSEEAILAAASSHDWSGKDDYATALATASDKRAYPATVAIYVMVKRDPEFAQQTERTMSYLRFLLQDFGDGAKDLGYVPMPGQAARAIENYWTGAISGA